ncbi:MAG TPA: MCE family protein [Mycobacterium sp.]|nr:MCE family protein [Mycobacterium sp.]
MLKYRGSSLIKAGLIGSILVLLVIAIGLQPARIVEWASNVRYSARFDELGGLMSGNDVTVSGMKVGSVQDISLDDGEALVTFSVKGNVPLGTQTTAHIQTATLLGQRMLTLESEGDRRMHPLDVIPASRTSSPYSLNDALGDLATNTAGTDTASLNQSLDTLSETLDRIAPQLGPTFDSLSRLSQSLNSRNQTLGDLFKSAADVSGILSERSNQVNTLILNANDLVGVLNDRRMAIASLLANTTVVAQQLKGLVADNEKQLAPTLDKVNDVTAMLEKNKETIEKALPGFVKFQLTQGETVSGGFYYNAFIPNITLPQIMQPFLDYAFGFRRGVDAGQPPDNAGPRAEFPWPYNGIPGGSR